MLDVLSGGRLVAGFPVGTSMDTNFAYGQSPITLRDKYYEAHDLIMKAWREPEPFAWNGRFSQLRYVNVWPRPLQQPHPPIWVPGGGSVETWEWVVRNQYLYAYLSYSGHKRGRLVMDGFWNQVAEMGAEPNPYRAGFLQLVAVSESDAQAEEEYAEAASYFFNRALHVYNGFSDAPGYRSLRSLQAGLRPQVGPAAAAARGQSFKELVAEGNIIAGSPESVTEQLRTVIEDLRVGHLMLLAHFGNLKKEQVLKNTRLLAERVLPNLRDMWGDWEDRWWIKPLEASKQARPVPIE